MLQGFLDLSRVKGYRFLSLLMASLALIIPGSGFIAITNFPLFVSLDTPKLILLSLLYSVPSFSIFLFLSYQIPRNNDKRDTDFLDLWTTGIGTLASFFIAVVVLKILIISNHAFTDLYLIVYYSIPLAFALLLMPKKRAS